MSKRTLTTALAAATLLSMGLAGCAKDASTSTTASGVELVEEGVLTICTHLPYEPFEFTEGGEVVGFDIDVLKAVAESEDLETKVIDTAWETIVSGQSLNNGDCDVATGRFHIALGESDGTQFPRVVCRVLRRIEPVQPGLGLGEFSGFSLTDLRGQCDHLTGIGRRMPARAWRGSRGLRRRPAPPPRSPVSRPAESAPMISIFLSSDADSWLTLRIGTCMACRICSAVTPCLNAELLISMSILP
jgi:hypothetical protein